MRYEAIINREELSLFSIETLNGKGESPFRLGYIYQATHSMGGRYAFWDVPEADFISDPSFEGEGWIGYVPREGDIFRWESVTGSVLQAEIEGSQVSLTCEPSEGRDCHYMEVIGLHKWRTLT